MHIPRKEIVDRSWDDLKGSESEVGHVMLLHTSTRTVLLGSMEVFCDFLFLFFGHAAQLVGS